MGSVSRRWWVGLALVVALVSSGCGSGSDVASTTTRHASRPDADVLEVRPVQEESAASCESSAPLRQTTFTDPDDPGRCLTLGPAVVDATDVTSAVLARTSTGDVVVDLELTDGAGRAIGRIGVDAPFHRGAILVHGRVTDAPVIQAEAIGGMQVHGLSEREARRLVGELGGDPGAPPVTA